MILWPRLRTVRSRGQKRCGIPLSLVDSCVPCRLATLGAPVEYTDCLLRALMRPRSAARPVPMWGQRSTGCPQGARTPSTRSKQPSASISVVSSAPNDESEASQNPEYSA